MQNSSHEAKYDMDIHGEASPLFMLVGYVVIMITCYFSLKLWNYITDELDQPGDQPGDALYRTKSTTENK